jgi:hypothetical protein
MEPALRIFHSTTAKSTLYRESILYKVLNSNLSAAYKSPEAMQNDIIGNVLAGTEAVANALLTISTHLITFPEDCRRLRLELQANPKTKGSQSEKLPFLVSKIPVSLEHTDNSVISLLSLKRG